MNTDTDSVEEVSSSVTCKSSQKSQLARALLQNANRKKNEADQIANGIYETSASALGKLIFMQIKIENLVAINQQGNTDAFIESVNGKVNEDFLSSANVQDIYDITDSALAFFADEISTLQKKVESDRKDAVAKKKHVDQMIIETIREYESAQHDMRIDGSIIVRIAEFNELFRQHKGTPGSGEAAPNSFYSNRFQTPDGFELRLRFFLNGAGKGKGTHISVFVQMCRTEFDEILPYPFQGICSVHLYDQNTSRSKKEHFTVKFKTNNSSCFQKPQTEFNPENGIAQFVSHDFLFNHTSDSTTGDKPIYMHNNVVFIGADVKYSSGMPRLFASSGEKNPGPGSKKGSGRQDSNASGASGSTAQLLPNEGAMDI